MSAWPRLLQRGQAGFLQQAHEGVLGQVGSGLISRHASPQPLQQPAMVRGVQPPQGVGSRRWRRTGHSINIANGNHYHIRCWRGVQTAPPLAPSATGLRDRCRCAPPGTGALPRGAERGRNPARGGTCPRPAGTRKVPPEPSRHGSSPRRWLQVIAVADVGHAEVHRGLPRARRASLLLLASQYVASASRSTGRMEGAQRCLRAAPA